MFRLTLLASICAARVTAQGALFSGTWVCWGASFAQILAHLLFFVLWSLYAKQKAVLSYAPGQYHIHYCHQTKCAHQEAGPAGKSRGNSLVPTASAAVSASSGAAFLEEPADSTWTYQKTKATEIIYKVKRAKNDGFENTGE